MRLVLQVQGGPAAGREVVVPPGQPFYVGRQERAYLAVPGDDKMGNTHFALECVQGTWWVRDLGTRSGTTVNGARVTRAELRAGDSITAGQSTFVVRLEATLEASVPPVAATPAMPAPVPAPTPPPREPAGARSHPVLDLLRDVGMPLYAILDAARDPLIYALLLQECKDERQSLYEGEKGEALALVAPYLVHLPPESPFLETLVEKGWGKCWGVFLTSPKAFAEVRSHLRRFLMVDLEGGPKAYFRYYDPRVLRKYLPTCTPDELQTFFGPIRQWVCESAAGDACVSYSRTAEGRLREQKRDALPV
jgi:hypothetical protein